MISNPLLDVLIPKLATTITKKILSCGKTESASTLYNRAILVSLSELSTVPADEASQASEIFLAIYLSFTHADRAPGLSIDQAVQCPS